MMGSKIKSIEYIFPENQITNLDLTKQFPDYDFGKFEAKVGIHNRYWASEDETALDLAVKACEKLFLRENRELIDYVLYCTQSPEYILPTTACLLQNRLGLRKDIGSLDFNLGCSGYVYGLGLAKSLVASGQAKSVLLVTAETYSKYLNEQDKSNRAIFGDGATATLVVEANREQLLNFSYGTDGGGYDKLIIKNGGTQSKRKSDAAIQEYGSGNMYTDNDLYMNGPEIFNFTAKEIPTFTKSLVEASGLRCDELDYFVFHQANAYMLEFLRKRMNVEKERFYINLEDGGNTVSNTIPIALKRLSDEFLVEKRMTIALVGFGVGFSWAGAIIEIDNEV